MHSQQIVDGLTELRDDYARITRRFVKAVEDAGPAEAITRYGEDVLLSGAQAALAGHFFQAMRVIGERSPTPPEEVAVREALDWAIRQARLAIDVHAGRRSTSPICQEQDRAAFVAAHRFLQRYQPAS